MSKRIIVLGLLIMAIIFAIAIIPRSTLAEKPGRLQAHIPEGAFLSQAAQTDICTPTNDILDPEPFQWTDMGDHYAGVLEYGQATFTINGESLTTRAYRQEGSCFSIPGPTLNMAPGNKYVLRFRNLLDYETTSSEHNVFKDPNITNVHTHGLHISGETPSDDVTRKFEGGTGGDYVYDIPADHMGGTFWYHAHHHGSTLLQVSTGGFGFIIIDDSNDGIPANVAAMEERLVLIGYLDPGTAGTGGDTLVSGTLPAGWTVNGTVNGDLTIPHDTWLHWRVLLADSDAKLKDVTVGPNCEVELLARDGVWRTTAPKPLPTNTVNLTGASRADLAVRCSANSDIKVANGTVANIIVDQTVSDPGPKPYADENGSTWSLDRPNYLRDLRNVTIVNTETVRMGARSVNGNKFDLDNPTFNLDANAVQEWSIKGATNHPFHLHVYHMQAQAGCGGDFEEGEYYDTLASSCSVRFDLNAASSTVYSGRTIMHCHILEHEDQGAMGWLNVAGGKPPPAFPTGQGYSAYYTLSVNPPAAPDGLAASATSSSTIDLAWLDISDNETSFNIERSTDGVSFGNIDSTGANSTSYSDTGLSPNTTYWYRVNAENGGGTSAYSNVDSAATDPLPQPPAAPTGLSAGSPTSSTIDLTWTDNAGNEDGFEIERSADGVNFGNIASVGANATTYIDSGLAAETTYWYQVRAFNTGGNSTYTGPASAATLADSGPTAVDLGSITATTYSAGKGQKGGQATVTVVDDLGAPVAGAAVKGTFSGMFDELGSELTDVSGTAVIETTATQKGSISVTFCVTSITHPTLQDWSGTGSDCASS